MLSELGIDPAEYGRDRVLQPITGFRTGWIGGPALDTDYNADGELWDPPPRVRRLSVAALGRAAAGGGALTELAAREQAAGSSTGNIRTRLVVGAGGHFCPVAKLTGAKPARENAVVAQEAEFEMDDRQQAGCRVRPDMPELYFCADIKGYGWCFRKHNFLNIGLGRMDQHRLSEHVAAFVRFLKSTGRISFDVPSALLGHAYLLYGVSERKVVDDGSFVDRRRGGLGV